MEGGFEINTLLEGLKVGKEKICVVGLGYVGLPLAVNLAKRYFVVKSFFLYFFTTKLTQ
uniref:Uncharacterized protein n=1 Tax=Thermocrinis ruber TaxID=75906 RepID=A0A7C5X0B3_9AQUI